MGESEVCPVDSFGKLKESSNVWVSDASLMPSSPGVNPQGTLLAMAHRNMDRFLDSQS
jgi:choline dehydrogenase-like flavoprotein